MTEDIKAVEVDHAFIMEVSRIMNAQTILCTILDGAIIKRKMEVQLIMKNKKLIMKNKNKKKFDANIKAINRDLTEISEGKLTSNELIKMQFEAIRNLIDDCERLTTTE